jgi:chromosome segregation ATPase
MDTDTLREKFIRSEEALSRLGDDVKQLVFSRAQELRESKDYLEALIKEKEAVDTQLTEQEAKIAANQEEISNKANLKEELVRRQSNFAEEAQQKEIGLEETHNEKKVLSEKLETTKKEIEKIKNEISMRREKIAYFVKTNQDLELKFQTELDTKDVENKKLEEVIKELEAENAVITYLLEESAEDIPEVDILAAVMKLGRTNKEQLKQELEGIISPVLITLITRTIGRMTEKNLLIIDESRDIVSLR